MPRPQRKGERDVLHFLVGLAFGIFITAIVDSRVFRTFTFLLAAVGIWVLHNDAGTKSPIPEDNTAAATAIKVADLTLENMEISRTSYGLGGYALSASAGLRIAELSGRKIRPLQSLYHPNKCVLLARLRLSSTISQPRDRRRPLIGRSARP